MPTLSLRSVFIRFALTILAIVMLCIPAVPTRAQSVERRIYELARALHKENTEYGSATYWIGGDMGAASAVSTGSLKVGSTMPDFKFTVFSTTEKLDQDGLSGPYLMNFWASWCPPCREEFPLIVKELEADNFAVPFIFVASNDKKQDSQLFLMKYPSSLRVLADERGRFLKQNEVRYIPFTVLVGEDNKIQAMQGGMLTETAVEFFQAIARDPGVGKFDRKQPDKYFGSDATP